MKIYGILDSNNCHIDISLSEKGTKRYATTHGYTRVSYRIEYNAIILAEKVNGKWENLSNNKKENLTLINN